MKKRSRNVQMIFPSALFGDTPAVREKLRKTVRYYSEHGTLHPDFFEDLMETEELLTKFPSTRVLFRPNYFMKGQDHFRLYLLYEELRDAELFSEEWEEKQSSINQLFDALLEYPWGILTLLSEGVLPPAFSFEKERMKRFFVRFLEYFEAFDNNKLLFEYTSLPEKKGLGFWNYQCNSLFVWMIAAGVPRELIAQPHGEYFSDVETLNLVRTHITDPDK